MSEPFQQARKPNFASQGHAATVLGSAFVVHLPAEVSVPSPLATLIYWGTWHAHRGRDSENVVKAWEGYVEAEPDRGARLRAVMKYLPIEARRVIMEQGADLTSAEDLGKNSRERHEREHLGASEPLWNPGTAEESMPRVGYSAGTAFVRGLEYVHVLHTVDGEDTQIWAGEMNQVPSVGDRIRLYVGGSDAYTLYWVEAVAWPLFCDKLGEHGSQGQPFVYVK